MARIRAPLKRVPLEDDVNVNLLKDTKAQKHAADVAIARAMVENGLTRKQAEEIYKVTPENEGQI